jgi:hypothetical protein
MTCSRCRGLMIEDQFLDMEGQYGQMWARSLRCVNCGRVHDSTIEQNRLLRPEKVAALRSRDPDYQDDEVHLGAESIIWRVA